MRKFRKHAEARRGFTLVEMLVAMVIGTILIMGMGTVLVTLFSGMRESKDFGTATGRVDLIRQLTFDARTGDEILFPAVGADGDYASGGNEGDQVQFNSLEYDPGTDTTTTVTVTWESRRPGGSPAGTPYTVYRFYDSTPEDPADPSDDLQTFAQSEITSFEIHCDADDSFSAEIETKEDTETVQVQLAVTLRNVTN
ncbi:MAG: prepilin-type N-terminal cleavage/methylation domain-containing protein [Planctomycetes bacterium]|nr:prepilin-type N-terminal cleavage/methylation domain-containing protein [Planctomycetota bacterium]